MNKTPLCYDCKKAVGKFQCAKCNWARYCCREHQKHDWFNHKRACFPLDASLLNEKNVILKEAFDLGLFAKFKELESKIGENKTVTPAGAVYFLFRAVVGMILFDPVDADVKETMSKEDDEQWQAFRADILKAYDWMEIIRPYSMWNSRALHWSFIPESLHKDIARLCGLNSDSEDEFTSYSGSSYSKEECDQPEEKENIIVGAEI